MLGALIFVLELGQPPIWRQTAGDWKASEVWGWRQRVADLWFAGRPSGRAGELSGGDEVLPRLLGHALAFSNRSTLHQHNFPSTFTQARHGSLNNFDLGPAGTRQVQSPSEVRLTRPSSFSRASQLCFLRHT
jgi:hypothetical protein